MITDWLENNGIEPKTSGKDVTRGWINIKCMWCHDHMQHLGISPTGGYHCWLCGKKGNLTELVRKITGNPWGVSKKIASELIGFEIKTQTYQSEWPKNLLNEPLPIHKRYLKKRGFSASYLIKKYKIKFTGRYGQNRFSIFAPMPGSYMLRSCISDEHHKGENAENILYNIERVKTKHAFLVEGLADCWNFDDKDKSDTIAALGSKLSHRQILTLAKFDCVAIVFDPDAIEKAIDLSHQLNGLVENIIYDEYGEWKGDPGEMPKEMIEEIKAKILK